MLGSVDIGRVPFNVNDVRPKAVEKVLDLPSGKTRHAEKASDLDVVHRDRRISNLVARTSLSGRCADEVDVQLWPDTKKPLDEAVRRGADATER